MSARQARGQLANLRAMAEQVEREEMHGGGYFQGAGATPSMGLSQFRGGSRVGGAVIRAANPRIEVMPNPSTALVRYNPKDALNRTGSTIIPYRPGGTSTTIKPYNAAEAQARLNALKNTPTTSKGISERLAAMGVTSSRVMAALAIGIPLLGLVSYFASGGDGSGSSGSSGNPNVDYPPVVVPPKPPQPPQPPVVPPYIPPYTPPGTGYIPPDTGYDDGEQPWWSYLQTVAPRRGRGRKGGASTRAEMERMLSGSYDPLARERAYYRPYVPPAAPPRFPFNIGSAPSQPSQPFTPSGLFRGQPQAMMPMMGSGRSDGRSARAAIVRKVMQEQGLKLIDASKYVKQHGLY